MSAPVTIRPMRREDMDAALAAVATHDRGLVDEARTVFERALEPDSPGKMVVAEFDGAVVGVMGYAPDRWGVPDVFWLEWLFVPPEHRRRGIAAALYGELERMLIERGCRKAYLDIGNADTHAAAIAFHHSQGFEREGTLTDYWADGEDFLIFGKRLRPVQREAGPE